MIKIFLMLFLAINLVSCCDLPEDIIHKTKIEKVYMQSAYKFIFLLENGTLMNVGGGYFGYIHYSEDGKNVIIFRDVPKEESQYIEFETGCSGGSDYVKYLYIHLHSYNDLNSAGWNRGKFGNGQTTEIK